MSRQSSAVRAPYFARPECKDRLVMLRPCDTTLLLCNPHNLRSRVIFTPGIHEQCKIHIEAQ